MKTILTFFFFFSFQLMYSQSSFRAYPVEEGFKRLPAKVSTVSPTRDTLWLLDEQIGYLIASTWDTYPTPEKKPVIIFTKTLPEPRTIPSQERKRRKKKSGQASL